jgi:integrase/recombinase XerD
MVSTNIMLYKHKTLSDGKHPILMQVIYNRKRKNISLGFSAKEKEWNSNKARFKAKIENSATKNMALSRFDLLGRKLIDEAILSGKPFSMTEFKRKLLGKQTSSTDFITFCEELIQEMITAGKIGNSTVYINVKNSIKSFSQGVLNFEDINVTFLHKYEVWLSKDKPDRGGCAPSTMNQYMRTVSAVFNKAISRGIIAHELYPFRNQFNPKGYSYSHLKSEPHHRALSPEELEKFKNFDVKKYLNLANAYYYFMFGYTGAHCATSTGARCASDSGACCATLAQVEHRLA